VKRSRFGVQVLAVKKTVALPAVDEACNGGAQEESLSPSTRSSHPVVHFPFCGSSVRSYPGMHGGWTAPAVTTAALDCAAADLEEKRGVSIGKRYEGEKAPYLMA
jgi:hypothetical protein